MSIALMLRGRVERGDLLIDIARRSARHGLLVAADMLRVVMHGTRAPRFGERVWIAPSRLQLGVEAGPHHDSARIVPGNWDVARRRVADNAVVAAAIRHWQLGMTWEESGAVDIMMRRIATVREGKPIDGCLTQADVEERCRRLDEMFLMVQKEGRSRTRSELRAPGRREIGGLLVHIGRDAEPLFGFRGCHRLAASLVIGLSEVPMQIGWVHRSALAAWRDDPRYAAVEAPR